MTLRETLELAAKAAGYLVKVYCEETEEQAGFFIAYLPVAGREQEYPTYWSEEAWMPHLDDGDSRRLQLACRLDLWLGKDEVSVISRDDSSVGQIFVVEFLDDNNGNVAAAARMAVLKAAAEIGKAMR